MISGLKLVWNHGGRQAAIGLLILGVIITSRQLALPVPAVNPSDFTPLSLDGVHRLLVLAPHSDDETLGSAGLILAARRAGIQVRVVIATNGDGSMSTAIGDLHKIHPHSQDFIKIGALRQQESLAALQVLGVDSSQVDFLSYPDRGSPSLWSDHWSVKNPYLSPYSRDNKSPYQLTYNKNSVYAGEDYLADLMSIIENYRPDMIVYPHPEDVHPDHWGLNAFTRLAITLVQHDDPAYRPVQFTYLVHRNDFPVVRGYRPGDALIPPPALYAISPDWYRWNLTPADVTLKYEAVLRYRSQLPTLRGLLDSFVRMNELFAPVTDVDLATVAQGDPNNPAAWTDSSGRQIPAVQLDPVHDHIVGNALPAGDLVAVYAARDTGNALWFCVEADENVSEDVAYTLHLKALTPTGIVDFGAQTAAPKSGWHKAVQSGKFVCDRIGLTELGNPYAIYLGASTAGVDKIGIDRVAWQMIRIDPVLQP